MYNLLHVDLGFNADNVLTMRLILQGGKYNPQTSRVLYDECLARVNAVPDVRSAALTHSLPIQGSNWGGFFIAADKPVPSRVDLPEADRIRVSPNYFETIGMRLLRGRSFTAADTPESAPVTVINETLARRIWPNENPIGKRIKMGFPEDDDPWREVIGVVNDIKMNGVERDTSMQMYLPFSQMPEESVGMVVRGAQSCRDRACGRTGDSCDR
jgi:MacB-like periplasmic core domain